MTADENSPLPERFEEVLRFDDEAVQRLLREIYSHELSEALRDAPPGAAAKFYRCMNDRAALMIREHSISKQVRELPDSHIQERRRAITERLRALMESGEIAPVSGPEEIRPDHADEPTVFDRLLSRFDEMLAWDKAEWRKNDPLFDYRDCGSWALALHGLPPETLSGFLSKAPKKNAENIRRAMDFLGPFRREDVELYRCQIAVHGYFVPHHHLTSMDAYIERYAGAAAPRPPPPRNGRGVDAGCLLFLLIGLLIGGGCLCRYGAVLGRFMTVALLLIALRLLIASMRGELTWRLLGIYVFIYILIEIGGHKLMLDAFYFY